MKKTCTPKLRFAEFKDSGEWQKSILGKVATFINQKISIEQLNLSTYISTENILPNYEGIKISSKLPINGSVTKFKNNDILISNIRPYLKKIWLSDREGGASNDVIVIRSNNTVIFQYLSFVIKNDLFIEYVMIGVKGTKMPRGDISSIKKFPILYPNIFEQKKIADCLSSIDEIITLQNEKIEKLKQHKKGLMQKLFPAEGETTPELRFEEFKDSGEWEEKELIRFAKVSIGLVTTMTTNYCEKGVPLIRNSDIKPNKINKNSLIYLKYEFANKYENKFLKLNDIVTVHTGDIGVSSLIDNELNGCLGFATLNTRVIDNRLLPKFLCLYFNSDKYINFAKSMSTGDGRNNFNLKDFEKSMIYFSSIEEQKKIADCLSSIDELIELQTQKLKQLEQHKKGLMQGLFPNDGA
jgi:type I restriction enzyme S subunit